MATTTTTPTGSPHTYNTERTENKTLYWVLGALALVLLAGIVYAYSGRNVDTVTTPATMEATQPAFPNEPATRGTTGTESQMNMGVGAEATPDTNPATGSDTNPATGSTPEQDQ